MSKSDEFREMQISSGQLAAVILALLALCIFVFYLGTRVGMKKAVAAIPAETATRAPLQTVTPPVTVPAVDEKSGAAQKQEETALPGNQSSATVASPDQTLGTKVKAAEDKPQPKPESKAPVETKPPAAETKAKAALPSGTYYIQAGALDTRLKAENFAQKIEALGFRAIVMNPLSGDRKAVYRVRVGPYETKETAETARGKLAEALKRKATDFFLVKG